MKKVKEEGEEKIDSQGLREAAILLSCNSRLMLTAFVVVERFNFG